MADSSSVATDELSAIEARMHEIVDRDEPIERGVWTRDEAIAFYRAKDEPFKIELVEAIPEGETVSYYTHEYNRTLFHLQVWLQPAQF